MTFLELAERVLRDVNKPLTVSEIWEIGKSKGYHKKLNSIGKTPINTIAARIYVDIRENPSSKFIKIKDNKPIRFFLKDLLNKKDINVLINNPNTSESDSFKFKEKDLHKYLSYYVYNYGFIYTKTISHEESSKSKFSQWQHPDVVGVYFPIENWEEEIIEFSKHVNNTGIKLFSYEIKRELNFNNLRESFFQAVSNSSWANEGYLVTAYIETDEEFMQEIKRLSNSFGIGIMKLDVDDPDSSEIIYPAKSKDNVDIDTMNKLAQINPNFKEFLKRIDSDLMTKEIRKEKYDKIYERDELINGNGLKKY